MASYFFFIITAIISSIITITSNCNPPRLQPALLCVSYFPLRKLHNLKQRVPHYLITIDAVAQALLIVKDSYL